MPDLNFFIDLHCHPNYKSFARAHTKKGKAPQAQSTSVRNRSSLWYYDPPGFADKIVNYFLSVTKFRQTDLTAARYGRLLVMGVGLGCVEKFFFKNKLGTGSISDAIDGFASEFGKHRINAIEGMNDYWEDLMREVAFMEAMENKPVKIDGQWCTYRFPKNFAELQANLALSAHDSAGKRKEEPIVLSLIPCIEGMHVLNCGLEKKCNPATVKANARKLRNLPNAPWYVTFSHHFYNELCGHARSLRGPIGAVTDQEKGINSSFTPLGLDVLDILLDRNAPGRRIYIDVKHMSAQARKEFYSLRLTRYGSDFPIIMSHGVCNGLPDPDSDFSNNPELGDAFIIPIEDEKGGDGKYKDHNVINFYDYEILEMVRSNGILGLQLDERRVANRDALKKVKHSVHRHKIMHYRSELLWKQVQYIAELLDRNNMFAWGNIAIGSDYDGMVDPLNSFWTAEELDDLAGYLERHAYNYFTQQPNRMTNAFNRIGADVVIRNIFRDNAWDFFRRWF